METDIQLPAGISLIPAIRKSSEGSENNTDRGSSDKLSASDCSFNTDISTPEDLKLSPIKNIHKRKHVDKKDKKPNKKMKVMTHEDELDYLEDSINSEELSESESDADDHDKSVELESSKDSLQDFPDKALQAANMDLNKDINDIAILKKGLSICPAVVDIKLENKECLENTDDELKSNLGSETEKTNDDLEFDITEKLREMGEISVAPVKKGFGDSEATKRKNDSAEDEVSVQIASKSTDGDDDEQSSAERKLGNLRRNIREVMDDQQLDAATLSAQREEMERLARVQEQQRIIREVQRQIALNRQNNKTQTRVLSLLQGNTSLLKQNSNSSGQRVSIPGTGTVLVKIPNKGVQKAGTNLTPSISIAPVKPSTKTVSGGSSESEPDVDIKPTIPIPKKVKKDVVTIVDSSSDDDCILLSDDEEPEDEPEEDTQNSGLHVNDAYNTPDEQGRVVINIGHPEGDSDIFLAPQIARVIKPHQIGGVRFLFDNIIESVERFNSSTGFGCILAHSMGLGKTLQLVCFCDIFLRHTTSKTVLCIMPINTLQNWMAEFNMWLPTDAENSPLKIHGEVRPRNFNLHVLNDSHKTLAARAKVIQDWTRDGGVLLIGYELYRLLSLKKMSKPKKRRGKNQAALPDDPEDIESNKKLLDEMFEALVKPGPDLVICDEGHRIKNSHAGISMALKQIRSKRRIVLTGYPLQNNLQEYWCMVDFVRPNYLGTKTEFANMFERPIQNGQCIDSTPQDIRLMRYRAHVLHSLLLGFVQRRSHAVLQTSLPQKEEYVLMLRMTPFQRKLYDTFMNDVVRKKAVPNALKAFAVCCKIWNHPDVLYHWLRKREADLDLDLEDGSAEAITNPSTNQPFTSTKNKKGGGRSRTGTSGRASKKDKKASPKSNNGTIATESTLGQETKPSAAIIPNSTGSCTSTDTISNDTNAKFFMTGTNPDNSDNAVTFSNIPNERNNMDYSAAPQTESNYTYQYPYSQNPYYPPKEEYRPPSYMPNQTQFTGENYNPYPQQQSSDSSYVANTHYWGQNYYMNQNADFNYSGYPNNVYNANAYENRYSNFENTSKTPENKSWNIKFDESVKPEDNKEWNVEKQQVKKEDTKPTENCDANMQACDRSNVLEMQSTVADAKKDESLDMKPENDIKISDDLGDIKPIIVNECIGDKALEDIDLQSVKLPVKDEGIPYDWAVELLKGYVGGVIGNSAKMEIFFCILEESVKLNDRILVFSQSLFTLNLIEDFLQKSFVTGTDAKWVKNVNYYRLDGSTSALEREKLINEFNANPNIHMFLVSTRAGSLGINLVGANRVIVFDASWNPCHDTQAVCRVYRYGQKKPCFVYRLVMDNCLERKIYDRQINKQGMADRVVDECNPDAHLSMKEVTNLCWDDELDTEVSDFSHAKDKYVDVVMQKVVESHSHALNKEPFQHESLLIDRKEKKLSQAEKRLAQRGYELEKQASSRPTYSYSSGSGMQYRTIRTPDGSIVHRPVASVRPMQADISDRSGVPRPGGARPTRWIPAEVWQRQGMTAQEMTLPLDVVIPTSSTEKSNIVLKAGQKVMVLKSPKGIYMQLESGKIIAIRTAFKVGQGNKGRNEVTQDTLSAGGGLKKSIIRANMSKFQNNVVSNLSGSMKNSASLIHSKNAAQRMNIAKGTPMISRKDNPKFHLQNAKSSGVMGNNVQFATAKPYNVSRNKLQVTSTLKSIGQMPPSTKSSNIIKSIEIDTNETCNAKEEESTPKPDSISLDEEQSKESFTSNEISDSRKETSPIDSQMDCGDSTSNFDNVLCSDEQETKNDLISEDISKLKLDADFEKNAEYEKNVTKLMPQDSPHSPKEVTEEDSLVMGIQEDTRDKTTEKENLDKPSNKQKTSLKSYRHKSSHKQTLVVPIISNADSLPAESSLSQLEKTASLLSDPNNRFQSTLSEITRTITPKEDENKLNEEKIDTNLLNGDVDIPGTPARSLHSNITAPSTSNEENQSENNYANNLQFDNNKRGINVENKKESDLLGIGTFNFPNTDNFVKNNAIQESQDTTKPESKPTPVVQQQLHHFPGYGHSETGITPSQPYPPPYAGYSYPTNCMPPYEAIYPAHTPQYHDPATYTGLFHGHSAFHRPEPMPVSGQDLNASTNFHHPPVHSYQSPTIPTKPAPYSTLNPTGSTQGYAPQLQNYTPQLPSAQLPSAQLPPAQLPPAQLPPSQISSPQVASGQIPQIAPNQIPSSQASSAQLPSSQMPSVQIPSSQLSSAPLSTTQLSNRQTSSSQLPPQPYPTQNPVPNYQLNVPTNGYANYPGQSIYNQFGGNYAPPPNPQAAYNPRSIYPSMEYGTPNYSAGYSPYPGQHANNQWAQ